MSFIFRWKPPVMELFEADLLELVDVPQQLPGMEEAFSFSLDLKLELTPFKKKRPMEPNRFRD